ncbi:endonuclease/exonuclease/phosphatase [Candidatus Mancarchaeum acidiphilum]|uniref:Endonuclease/exonuclease/phosphatase n=1 Tax=Candidatus Mancarchaeum acidiphilum TaxID=1920749 RepID=A0A218NMP4_9ARCH|nr:endonuclease/exonuclease/phosphatase family protein [Candidatus Mancarchaeum acidiphilum]ASI13749.1 endonuclease/exonuclease/phosphatase [Candidatus Mancarchaeum acidiphilum]
MRMISLNLWGGRAFEGLKAFLNKEKGRTDIFCFQETLQYSLGRPDNDSLKAKTMHQPKEFSERENLYADLEGILDGYKGFLTDPYSSGKERLSMFIKDGISASEDANRVVNDVGVTVDNLPYKVGCIMQHASVTFENKTYDICNTHGLWQHSSKEDTPERLQQSENIIKLMSKMGPRRVLAGDFNLLPDTRSIKMLEDSGMRNLIKEYNITDTRGKLYTKKIRHADYTFVSNAVDVKGFRVLPVEASDHLPMALEFN